MNLGLEVYLNISLNSTYAIDFNYTKGPNVKIQEPVAIGTRIGIPS